MLVFSPGFQENDRVHQYLGVHVLVSSGKAPYIASNSQVYRGNSQVYRGYPEDDLGNCLKNINNAVTVFKGQARGSVERDLVIAIVAHGKQPTGNLGNDTVLFNGSSNTISWTPEEFLERVLKVLDKTLSIDIVCVQCWGAYFADKLRTLVADQDLNSIPRHIRIEGLNYGPTRYIPRPAIVGNQELTIAQQLNIPDLELYVQKNMRYFRNL